MNEVKCVKYVIHSMKWSVIQWVVIIERSELSILIIIDFNELRGV